MTCHLRDINKVLRYHTLCKSILKCEFPTKGIEQTWFVLFVRTALRYLGLDHFGRFGMKICEIQVRIWNKKF